MHAAALARKLAAALNHARLRPFASSFCLHQVILGRLISIQAMSGRLMSWRYSQTFIVIQAMTVPSCVTTGSDMTSIVMGHTKDDGMGTEVVANSTAALTSEHPSAAAC